MDPIVRPSGELVAAVMFRRLMLTGSFVAFLYPVVVNGISVNYSFVLLPLIISLVRGRVRNPGEMLLLSIAFFALVFFVASLYQFQLLDETGRRFISFAIFLSIFLYAFISVDAEMVTAFKTAVVGVSVVFSIASIYELFAAGGGAVVGFAAKELVGSQRVGFIYLVGFWLVYLDPQQKRILGVTRYAILLILLAGLLLTFSRSSIITLLATAGLFAVSGCRDWLRHLTVRGFIRATTSIIGAFVFLAVLYRLFPLAFEFFDLRLFALLSDSNLVMSQLLDQTTSEGTRVKLAVATLDFVARNPVTGSGYLGIWILPDITAGSAHSQYLDVLFRTGWIGLFAYLCIILSLLRYLSKHETPLFWGFVSVLIYGLFHETFKESQGTFVLAFLLGMMAQFSRDQGVPVRTVTEPRASP